MGRDPEAMEAFRTNRAFLLFLILVLLVFGFED